MESKCWTKTPKLVDEEPEPQKGQVLNAGAAPSEPCPGPLAAESAGPLLTPAVGAVDGRAGQATHAGCPSQPSSGAGAAPPAGCSAAYAGCSRRRRLSQYRGLCHTLAGCWVPSLMLGFSSIKKSGSESRTSSNCNCIAQSARVPAIIFVQSNCVCNCSCWILRVVCRTGSNSNPVS